MIVISDNSPLQYLVLLGHVEVLQRLYERVLTTPQVIDELLHPGTPELVRDWAAAPPNWLMIASPSHVSHLDHLDIGEASAISLAQERNAQMVLIDERAGTETVRGLGVNDIGTIGILIEAGVAGLINFEDALARLKNDTPFYATGRLLDIARRAYAIRKAAAKNE